MAFGDFPHIKNDLERLQYDEYREKPSLIGDVWLAGFCGLAAAGTVVIHNTVKVRPLYAGLWQYALAVPLGAALGIYSRDKIRERSRVKWAKIRHYIELHPEDFPDYPPRLKVASTLAPWVPVRTGW